MSIQRKNFFQFFKSQKVGAGFWMMVFMGSLLGVGTTILELKQNRLPLIGGWIFLSPIVLYLFFNAAAYRVYKKQSMAMLTYNNVANEVLLNLKVCVKNFDLWAQKNVYRSMSKKTIYEFDAADIVLSEKGMLVLGHGQTFIMTGYASPVVLLLTDPPNEIGTAEIVGMKVLENKRIEISIRDPAYNHVLILQFHPNDRLLLWVEWQLNKMDTA